MQTLALDDTDRRIILATQAGLPLTPRPYHTLAEQLDLPPDEVIRRLQNMLDRGVIRRIGVVPNHYRIGYTANGMTVWDVPDERVDELGEQVGRMPSVSHCYHRPRHLPDWPYNLFAMVHGRTRADVEREADRIAEVLGAAVRGRSVLYSTRILKKTGLRLQS
jgi:DNA-binding Lrp family transcriptional regulator